jgi:hypothetical protein
MSPSGVLFTRVPLGLLVDLPKAGRRVYEALHGLARKSGEIRLADRELVRLIGTVGRRAVQKGLKQLEDLGVIDRFRTGGRRLIKFLVRFAGKSPAPATATNTPTTSSPRDPGSATAKASYPQQNVSMTGEQTAKWLTAALQAKGWRNTLLDDGRLQLVPIRDNPEPVGVDLGRFLRMHRDDLAELLSHRE